MAAEDSQRTGTRGSTLQYMLSSMVGSKVSPLAPQPAVGFFTDTSLCIGCKACEIACKQWNQLPASDPVWTGSSYDNTGRLSATTWRHVLFIEHIGLAEGPVNAPGTALPFFNTDRWLMQSDVCKHCANAPCQEACPTGSIIRTEFDTVYVQQEICNGCGYCVVACPFGVIERDADSIQFGEVEQLKAHARERLGLLHERGVKEARLYGVDDDILDGGLNSFFLLLDEPEVYNLPQHPQRPSNNVVPASLWTIAAAAALGLCGILFFKK